jgi:protocatechuate 3,4-dioxygenase beta subunit
MFSFYVDRQQTSEVNFFIYDYIGVANGYLTPQEKTISIISDTTRVDIALTPATSFIEGYVKDQMGVPIKNAKITASYSFLVRTKTDSIGYYKLGVQEGTWYCNANISWTTEYLRTNSISADINVPANATVRHDFMFIKSNNTISGRVTFDANGVGGVPIYVSTDSLSNSVLSSTDGNYSIPVYMPTVGTELYTVSADVGNGYFIDNSVRMNIMPGTTNVNFVITKVTGGLQGRITDIATGQPIPRAYIHASGSVNSKSVLSNDSGYYRISLLDGIYSLEVEAEPYFTYSESDIIISGSMVTKNIALHRSGSFSGKVIDIDGKPLQSVDVVALDSSGSSVGYGYSDEQGNYVVSGLGTSQYRAYSSKNGYVAQWYDNVSVLDSATFFQVTEGYDTPNINFVISRGGSISGKVVDKSGIPIIDVEIDVLDTLFNYQSYATTNDSGNYTISGLLTGNYYVRTYSSQYYDQWYDGASNSSDAKQVSVVINQNTPDINFILSAGASISGAVNDKNNVGIPYASISLLDSTLYIVAYYSTNRSGYYSIGKLVPAKTYYAYASASGYADRWYDNVSTPDSATAIVLQPEEKREHIDFILHKAGSISGRVFDEAGNPISYANVYSQDRSGNYIGYGYSDYMGNYTITNLNNGIYYIEASSYGYIDQWYDHKATIEQADQVTVVEDQETPNINFNLKRFTEDSIIVKIELANIPDTLLFSQDYVQDYNNDYWWGMRFNVDGDNSTGPNGCEIEIALTHYKSPGETAYKSDIINGTSHALIEWIGNNGYWQHSDVSAWIDPSNKNTLVMSVPKSWPEIQNIGTNTKYYVYSFYYSNSGVFSDVTRMGQGMVSITDPVGDVGFNFVDIIAANWSIKVPTSVQNVDVLPTVFKLDQNYPNPFNPSTIIAFDLPHSSLVSLKVYNILGQEVAMLVNEIKSAGHYATVWDAAGIPSGTYFYRLTYDNQIVTRKMLLLR